MPSMAWWTSSPLRRQSRGILQRLHAGEGLLDAGADFAMGGDVFLFPGREFGLAAFAAVRDDQAGAPVAAARR